MGFYLPSSGELLLSGTPARAEEITGEVTASFADLEAGGKMDYQRRKQGIFPTSSLYGWEDSTTSSAGIDQ